MLSVLVIVELVHLHSHRRYVILVNVIETLINFDDWSTVSVRQGIVTSMSVLNTDYSRTIQTQANKEAITAHRKRNS